MIFILIINTKYVMFKYATKKIIWIKIFIKKIKIKFIKSLILYNNNEISITLTKNAKN